jgi:D-glucosaminate-6-phosphate ammonia-lyase
MRNDHDATTNGARQGGTTGGEAGVRPAQRPGATRRQVLQGGGVLAAAGLLLPSAALEASAAGQRRAPRDAPAPGGRDSIYASIGVPTLLNARGTVTIVGASRVLPEVQRAMEAAAREYVHFEDLMDGVGRRLAALTGTGWGIVTSGASAALTVAAAGCITGGDPDKLAQLPDLRGLKDEAIVPRYSRTAYDHAIKVVGARMVEVEDREQFEAALGPRTALVLVLAGRRSEEGPLSLREIASLAAPRGVPVLVDAAADELVVPNPYLEQGADLVVYSGGKCLRGPQCAGLLLGREDLVRAAWVNSAPHHGLGRGFKVGREEIMGMLAAVEAWMHTRDHAAEQRTWAGWLEHVAGRLADVPGVTTRVLQPQGRSNRTPTLLVEWDPARVPLTGQEMEQALWDGEPRIAVSGAGSFLPFPPNTEPNIRIVPYQLEAGEERIVAERVRTVLLDPPRPPRRTDPPAADVSGQWDVALRFVAGTGRHTFAFEQQGSELLGTHHASFASRDLAGTLHGDDLLVRSSYTEQGVRLNMTFTGKVTGDTMEGTVQMGEYGTAEWKAARRGYRPPGARRG